ncbi:hypothetical protein GCM10011591_03180 [Nocardia camponoti]|uniref:Uncharacterized protein n=1 Tax=Nocardia camponoti TaxID=1616106 RepID=A0A917Q8Q1_9NOCA|nr:hypothetical protein GCM10011591_03180 [Nocardia camponoti]
MDTTRWSRPTAIPAGPNANDTTTSSQRLTDTGQFASFAAKIASPHDLQMKYFREEVPVNDGFGTPTPGRGTGIHRFAAEKPENGVDRDQIDRTDVLASQTGRVLNSGPQHN